MIGREWQELSGRECLICGKPLFACPPLKNQPSSWRLVGCTSDHMWGMHIDGGQSLDVVQMAGLRKSLDHAVKSLSNQRTAMVNVTGTKLLELNMRRRFSSASRSLRTFFGRPSRRPRRDCGEFETPILIDGPLDGRLRELVEEAGSGDWHLKRLASGEVALETTESAEGRKKEDAPATSSASTPALLK